MPVGEDQRQIREVRGASLMNALAVVSGYSCLRAIAWLLLAMTLSPQLAAQGLGDEVILSRLGDPVEVEIAVKDWQQLDLGKVVVANASHQQYESFKLTYLPLLDSLNFNVVGPNLAGEVKILVSSRQPVAEPFLDLLLVMKWPDGSSMREYVLLFDPPLPNFSGAGEAKQKTQLSTSTDKKPAAKTEKPAAPPAPTTRNAAKVEQPDVHTQTAIEVKKVTATDTAAVDDGRRQYRVRNGDSLWNIARQFHPAGIGENLYQFLISLHDLNRDAFINGNISMLKADAPLHIPSARDIAAINPASAQSVFEQLWRDGIRSPDVAASGQSAPQFKPLNESAEQKQPPAKTPEQKLPLGSEKQDRATATASPLQPAPTSVIPAATAQSAPAPAVGTKPEAAPVPAIQVIPQQARTTEPKPAAAAGNRYLQQITDSATTVQGMLELRRQRLVALEQQIMAMQTELQRAQLRASELNQGLSSQAEVTRKAVLMGVLAAVLLILLVATVWYSVKWSREISRRN